MKKRIIKGVCLLLILLNLTGCVKFNVNMGINKDKSMDFSIVYAIDTQVFADQEIFSDEDIENAKKNGFDVGTYAENKMRGFTLTRKVKNIDLVSTSDNYVEFDIAGIIENKQNSYLFKVDKGFFKNKYTAKIRFSSEDSDLEIENNYNDSENNNNNNNNNNENKDNRDTVVYNNDITRNTIRNNNSSTGTLILEEENTNYEEMLLASMDLKFKVTLPYSALTNNATKTNNDNKTLIWRLSKDEVQYMEFQFELYNMTNIYIGCAVVGLGIILIVLVIILVIKNKKKNKNNIVDCSNQSNVQNNNLNNENLINNNLVNQQVVDNNDFQTTNVKQKKETINNPVDMTKENNNTLINNMYNGNEYFNNNHVIQSNNNSQIVENSSITTNAMKKTDVNNKLVNNIHESNIINQPVMNLNKVNTNQNNLNKLENNNNEQNNNLLNVIPNVVATPTPVNYENIVVNNNFNTRKIDNGQNIINNQQFSLIQKSEINMLSESSNNNESLVNSGKIDVNNASIMNNSMSVGSYIHIPGQDENNQMNNSQSFTSINNNVVNHSNITIPTPIKVDTNFSNIVNNQNQNNGNN